MGWLQRMPQAGSPVTQLYRVDTWGQQRIVLLVGLGNPGRKYEGTRHNVGFICLDDFIRANEEMSGWTVKKGLKAEVSEGRLGNTQVIAIKPQTFMNLSGEAVQTASAFYKVHPESILVIHDDLDITFGQIRLRMGGSSAGHNGIKSVSQIMGEGYGRIRIGIGPKQPPEIDSTDFVLQKFTSDEEKQLPNLTREVNAVLIECIYSGQLPTETRNFLI
jgi:PTH1 family peptidyl-tRNA hydrolase